MQSKSNASHRAGDVNNVQLTETRGIQERYILLDVPYLISPW